MLLPDVVGDVDGVSVVVGEVSETGVDNVTVGAKGAAID